MSKAHVPALHGIGVDDDELEVSLPGGNLKLGGVLLPGAANIGSRPIQAARAVVRGQFAEAEGSIRQAFRSSLHEYVAFRREAEKRRTPSGLATGDKAKLDRLAKAAAAGGAEGSKKAIASTIADSVRRELRAQTEAMRKLGLAPPSASSLSRVADATAASVMGTPFPGTGVSSDQRLAALQVRADSRIREVSKFSGPAKELDAKLAELRQALHDTSSSQTRVAGGSVSKNVARIQRTETARAMQEASLALFKERGVGFAYWRLSAQHRYYNGKEVCERLSIGTGPDVVERLEGLKVDLGVVDLQGLYTTSNFPHIPHPHCMCFAEPYVPPALLRDTVIDSLVQEGDAPEDLLSSSQVPDSFVSTFNRFASSLGLEPGFDRNSAKVLGAGGMAALIVESVSPKERGELRAKFQQLQAEMTPKIHEQISSAREKAAKLRGEIERNTLLSPRTQASQIASLQEDMRREITQAMANISALMAMQDRLDNPAKQVYLTRTTDYRAAARQLQELGYTLEAKTAKIVRRKGGQFVIALDAAAFKDARIKQRSDKAKTVQAIKDLDFEEFVPLGIQKAVGGRKFVVRKDQQAGLKFIEQEQNVLLHYGAGLGKTPLVIASVSDLHAKGNVQSALISTPAALRSQMAAEVLAFNAEGKVSLYVAEASVSAVTRALHEEIRSNVFSDRSLPRVLKEVDALDDDGNPIKKRVEVVDRDKVPQDVLDGLDAEVAKRIGRLSVKGVARDDAQMHDALAEDRSRGVLFTVMSHDDLASRSEVAKKSFDYIAIDEIHQMTSQDVSGASGKARGLQALSDPGLKYKVALTGTASRNNLGEFWDIANWLRPGFMGDKQDFVRQYDGVTLNTDVFRESLVRMLRQRMADFTYTRESPLDVRLNNAFRESHPSRDGGPPVVRTQAERDKFLRRLTMTSEQTAKAAKIEREYQTAKKRSESMSAADRTALLKRLDADRRSLSELLDNYAKTHPDLVELVDSPNLATSLRGKRFSAISDGDKQRFRDLVKDIAESSRLGAPESWRDNQHHMNVHGGDARSNAKVQEVQRLMKSELKGKRPIIHVERYESLQLLKETLEAEGLKIGTYDGSMDSPARDAMKRQFNGGMLDAIIVTRAGSTGVNFQKASTSTIHFDLPWTYAEYLQREARNWRTGQEHEVDSYVLHQDDSHTDRARLDALMSKKATLEALDEVSRLVDSTDPLALLRAKGSPLAEPLVGAAASRGESDARKLLDELRALSKDEDALLSAPLPRVAAKIPVGALDVAATKALLSSHE